MKTEESKLHKRNGALLRLWHTLWKLLGKYIHRGTNGNEVIPNDLPKKQPDQHLNPLDQIKEYLLDHGLGRRVHVRFDDGAGDFVVEDDDGAVHAKDYDKAVAVIKRTWL